MKKQISALLINIISISVLSGCGTSSTEINTIAVAPTVEAESVKNKTSSSQDIQKIYNEYKNLNWKNSQDSKRKTQLLKDIISKINAEEKIAKNSISTNKKIVTNGLNGDVALSLYQEYLSLSWYSDKEKKLMLLQAIGNTNETKIIQGLLSEYQSLSWYSDKEKKQVLVQAVGRSGNEMVAKTLLSEYQSLSWYSDKERKKLLIDLIGYCGSNTIAQSILSEYQSLSWYSEKEKKQFLLQGMSHSNNDLLGKALLSEYQSLSWYSDKEKKELLLKTLTAMGNSVPNS